MEPSSAYPLLAPVVPQKVAGEQQTAEETTASAAIPKRLPSELTPPAQVSRGPGLASTPSVRFSRPTAPRTPSASLPTTYRRPSLTSIEHALASGTEKQPPAAVEHAETPGGPSSARQAEAQQPKMADGPAESKPEQTAPQVPPDQPQTSPLPEQPIGSVPTTAVEELPSMAWSRFDRIAASQSHLIDRAPHIWRALQSRLLLLDASYLRDSRPGIPVAMRGLVRQLDDLANGRMPRQYREHDLVVELARLLYASGGDPPEWSLALVVQIALRDSGALPDELASIAAGFDAMIAAGNRADFAKWIAELPPHFDRYAECRQARRFSLCTDLEWPVIRLALHACRNGEKTAAETLETGRWTRRTVERADEFRRATGHQPLRRSSNSRDRAPERSSSCRPGQSDLAPYTSNGVNQQGRRGDGQRRLGRSGTIHP